MVKGPISRNWRNLSYELEITIVIVSLVTTLLSSILLQATAAQQTQNWTTYEDPILGIQFEHPSWWKMEPLVNSIKFYFLTDTNDMMYNDTYGGWQYFLPPLPEEMNTLENFTRTMMLISLLSPDFQNISVNRTSNIGVDNIPAYKFEFETLTDDDTHSKNIWYFTIDKSTGTGYVFTLSTDMDRLQEDAPFI